MSPGTPEPATEGHPASAPYRADELASRVLEDYLSLRARENVIIEIRRGMLPYARAFARATRRAGGSPLILYEDEDAWWDSVEAGDAAALGRVGEHEWAALEKTNVYVFFWGPVEDYDRFVQLQQAQFQAAFAFNTKWYELAKSTGVRGLRVGVALATPSIARRLGISTEEYLHRLVDSALVQPSDLRSRADLIVNRLRNARELRITHPNGTDLRLRVRPGPPRVDVGIPRPASDREPLSQLMDVPAGQVEVELEPDFGDGLILSDRRSVSRRGSLSGQRWEFREGRLISATAESGGEAADALLKKGDPVATRMGCLGFGLNPLARDLPAQEAIGEGAVTLGIGGTTLDFRVDWASEADIRVTQATVRVDGQTLIESGEFQQGPL